MALAGAPLTVSGNEVSGFADEAMGRFKHEAAAVDPSTGWVYMTEDNNLGKFYRYRPNGTIGDLDSGGTLEALVLNGSPGLDTSDGGFPVGTSWQASWIPVPDPRAQTTPVYLQVPDAARIDRGEGLAWNSGRAYFTATSGGAAGLGQIFSYDPRRETVTLLYESTASADLAGPDNLTVSPRGSLLICEDGATSPKRVVALPTSGTPFPLVENHVVLAGGDFAAVEAAYPGTQYGFVYNTVGDYRHREMAGISFFGRWMFMNIQIPGITFAITGPWDNGAV